MKKISLLFVILLMPVFVGCDLQPKILSLPDSVGDFISQRYPALLADPNAQPEIYASAATDYDIYASPDLYGSDVSSYDDYVMYASVDDYIVPPQSEERQPEITEENNQKSEQVVIVAEYQSPDDKLDNQDDYLQVPMYGTVKNTDEKFVVVARGDTLYSLAKQYEMSVDELAKMNSLERPYVLSVGQRLKVAEAKEVVTAAKKESKDAPDLIAVPAKKPTGVQTTTRVALKEVTIGVGDTLYSVSRKYSVPVNDLAVLNNLKAPFVLSVGQKLKVPDLAKANVKKTVVQNAADKKVAVQTEKASVPVKQEQKKISSDPTKKLPTISARSSSKFSWPIKGKILSGYGAKSGGLFNDGINIGAAKGTTVKAAENGVVAYAGNEVKGMGNLIIVQHAAGWMTVYAHMDSLAVRRGTRVNVGQKIGTVGETGKVDTPQLHFEIRKGTKAYNPTAHLK